MLDRDSIEAINVEQLVTATDRLLLTGLPRRRASSPAIAPRPIDRIAVKPRKPALAVLARVAFFGVALGYAVGQLCAAVSAF